MLLFRQVSAVVAVFLFASPLQAGEPKNLGPQQCASCHTQQTEEWQGHRHAKAFDTLPENERLNPLCLSCHAPDPERREAGVTCEACHGAGSEYAVDHIMRDPYLRGFLGLKKVEVATCARCHQGAHTTKLKPVDVLKLWNQLHHSRTAPTPQATPAPAPAP